MPDDTLILLTTEVRGKTLRLLEGLSDAAARFTGPPAAKLNNSILWHAGHSLIVVEHLAAAVASGLPPQYPQGWFDTFSWKSNPATITVWPALTEVVDRLNEQKERVAAAVGRMTCEQLNQIVDPARNRSARYSILHGFHDEAGHQGEIYLLKKLAARIA